MTLSLILAVSYTQQAPIVLPLWPNGAPGSETRRSEPEQAKDWWVKNVHNPSITVSLPAKEKMTGAAVVVFPGGGHSQLVFNPEGKEPAEYLQSHGIAAIAVKYRLAREEGSPYRLETDIKADGYRAMRVVRSHAAEWGIDPKRIGVLGFSAGGEVVSMIAYGSGQGDPKAMDPVDRLNGKPSFQMLVYPGPLGIPDEVPTDAPPTFLMVANDDGLSPVVLGILEKLRRAKVPVEAHVLARGGHGFNMGNRSKLTSVNTWPQRMMDWLSDSGWLKRSE